VERICIWYRYESRILREFLSGGDGKNMYMVIDRGREFFKNERRWESKMLGSRLCQSKYKRFKLRQWELGTVDMAFYSCRDL
jgi:hypothetical protein